MPYMLLAFIHHPILTTFTYLTLVLFIVCIYLLCLGVCHLYKFWMHKKYKYPNNKCAKFLDYLLYFCMVWAMAFSLIIFLFVVTYIITLGSFEDFKDLKYLTPSLPLAVIGLFLLKPAFTFMSNRKYKEPSNNVDRKVGQGQTENNDDDNQTQQITFASTTV